MGKDIEDSYFDSLWDTDEPDPEFDALWDQPNSEPVVPDLPTFSRPDNLWGAGRNLADAYLLGAGQRLSAGTAAVKAGQPVLDVAREALGGEDRTGRTFGSPYSQALSRYQNDRKDWQADNTGQAILTEVLGAAPMQAAGVGALGTGLKAGGNALTRLGMREVPTLTQAVAPQVGRIAQFVGGQAGQGAGVGNSLLRAGSRTAEGALAGAAGGAMGAGLNDYSLEDNALLGAAGGGLMQGVIAPALRAGLPSGKLDPEVAKLAKKMLDEGVDLRLGQVSGNPTMRGLDHMLNGRMSETQQGQFIRALSRTFGADSDRLTPEVMEAARNNIGTKLDDIGAKIDIPMMEQGLMDDLADIAIGIEGSPNKAVRDWVKSMRGIIETELVSGGIPGKTYQSLTQKGSKLDLAFRGKNPELKQAATEIKHALWGAMERSVGPDEAAQLGAARQQYKHYMLANDLTKEATDGTIDPTKLQAAVVRSYGADKFSKGDAGQIGDLARGGKHFLNSDIEGAAKSMPTWLKTVTAGGGLYGAAQLAPELYAYAAQHPMQIGLAGMAGVGAAGLAKQAGNALSSPELTNALIRRSLRPSGVESPLRLAPAMAAGNLLNQQ